MFEVDATFPLVFPLLNIRIDHRGYPLEDGFNFDGIESPTPINQTNQVEKQNKIAINVFGYENKVLRVYRFTKKEEIGLTTFG